MGKFETLETDSAPRSVVEVAPKIAAEVVKAVAGEQIKDFIAEMRDGLGRVSWDISFRLAEKYNRSSTSKMIRKGVPEKRGNIDPALLGSKMKNCRAMSGLSLLEVAEELGMKVDFIGNLELGNIEDIDEGTESEVLMWLRMLEMRMAQEAKEEGGIKNTLNGVRGKLARANWDFRGV